MQPTTPEPTPPPPSVGLRGNAPEDLLARALESHPSGPAPGAWTPPDPEHLSKLLPEYPIECLIGRGGMGAVYKGRQRKLNRTVAIKVLPAELAQDNEFIGRFHREAHLLASLNHPGIVTIFDFGQTSEGHLYFVMEYVEGTDLHRLIHKTKLDAKQALALTIQICEAMQYAHDKGVIHRDIKPANVLVTPDGQVKLADFGLAMKPTEHVMDVPEPPQPDVFDPRDPLGVMALRFTKPGTAMGTVDYAAPEVYEGKADERSDIYALGIMLYEMLTGETPKGYFALPSTRSKADKRVDGVVIKALEIEPSDRYQKASDMKLAVEQATMPLAANPPEVKPPVVETQMQVIRPGPRPQARARSRDAHNEPPHSKGGTVGFVTLAILILGGAGAWYGQGHWPAVRRLLPSSFADTPGGASPGPLTDSKAVDPLAASPSYARSSGSMTSPSTGKGVETPSPDGSPKKSLEVPPPAQLTSSPGPPLVQGGKTAVLAAPLIERLSSKDELEKVLLRSDWSISNRDMDGREWHWDMTFQKDHILIAHEDVPHYWHWWATQSRTIHVQVGADPAAFDPKIGFDFVFNDSLTSYSGERVDHLQKAHGARKSPMAQSGPTATGGVSTPGIAFTNTLGMKFVPVPGTKVLFSIYDTRVKDFAAFVAGSSTYAYSRGADPRTLDTDGRLQRKRYSWKDPGFTQTDEHPVTCVSWEDAEAFCAWLSKKEGKTYRLPTDREWSVAVGIGNLEDENASPESNSRHFHGYPWGGGFPPPNGTGNYAGSEALTSSWPSNLPVINGFDDGFSRTSPVGSFKANQYALYDVSGNVWQWCEDKCADQPGRLREFHVFRGGSWSVGGPGYLMVSYRNAGDLALRCDDIGFRVVLQVDGLPPPKGEPTGVQAKSSLPYRIVEAKWGWGKNNVDVTDRVRFLLEQGNTVTATVEVLQADPLVGKVKELRVLVIKNGDQSEELRVGEGENLPLAPTSSQPATATAIPASQPKPSTPVASLDIVGQRLAKLNDQFRTACDREAGRAVEQDIAALNKRYLVSDFAKAIAEARRNNVQSAIDALDKERNNFVTTWQVPAEDTGGVPDSVKHIRAVYREARAKCEAGRANKPSTAALYETYLQELHNYSNEVQAIDRDRVRKKIREIALLAGRDYCVGSAVLVSLPRSMRARCSSGGVEKLRQNGGSTDCDVAVSKALDWLKTKQNADGSWGTTDKAGTTGMVLLSYLGRCETPESIFYGDEITKGVLYLVEVSKKNEYGMFAENLKANGATNEHGIATYALGEMYTLARLGSKSLPGMKDAFEKGVDLIIKNQKAEGGWGYGGTGDIAYNPEGGSDLSVTGWQYQALKAAKYTGLKIPKLAFSIALTMKYLERLQTKDGGIGGTDRSQANNQWNLTGTGVLGLQTLGKGKTSIIDKGIEFLRSSLTVEPLDWNKNCHLYRWYYCTQAFYQKGGDNWKFYNEMLLPQLLNNQLPDGSWKPEQYNKASESDNMVGGVRKAALCTLMLEVYYRHSKVTDREEDSFFDKPR